MRFKYFTCKTSGRSLIPKKDRCPKCGIKRSPGYNLCLTCGYRFFGESQQKIRPKDNSREKIFPPISELLQSKAAPESKMKCLHCGMEISTGAKFCATCGKKIEDKQTIPSIQEEKDKIPIRNCPKCGEELLTGAKFCFTCGIKIEEVESKPIVSTIKKDEPKIISRSESQLITGSQELWETQRRNEQAYRQTIPPPESQHIVPVSEIRKEDPETISPPEPQPTAPVPEIKKEEQAVITPEVLTPIPPIIEIETKKSKLKPVFCNFCGIRIPKKTPFCLQCGMIIKNK